MDDLGDRIRMKDDEIARLDKELKDMSAAMLKLRQSVGTMGLLKKAASGIDKEDLDHNKEMINDIESELKNINTDIGSLR